MIFIPEEWLVKPENMDRILELLEQLGQDFVVEDIDPPEYEILKAIRELGELTILDKLAAGELSLEG